MLNQEVFLYFVTVGLIAGVLFAWFYRKKGIAPTLGELAIKYDAEVALIGLLILIFGKEPSWLYVVILTVVIFAISFSTSVRLYDAVIKSRKE